MKKTLLHTVVSLIVWGGVTSCIWDDYENNGANAANETVGLSLSIRMLASGSTRADAILPTEQIHDLRVVVVDLGVDSSGQPIADQEATVEANVLLREAQDLLDRNRQRKLKFEKILADRQKRLYFLANCESDQSPWLAMQRDGEAVDLSDPQLYLPDASGKAPIEACIFTAPTGDFEEARADAGEPFAGYRIPVTAVHTLAVPSVDVLKASPDLRPDLDAQLTYYVKQPLYLVRAANKLDLSFENITSASEGPSGASTVTELRLKELKITEICTGQSWLFAHLNEQDDLFDDYQPANPAAPLYERPDLNPAWMQWVAAEADKTQAPDSEHGGLTYEWLTDYSLPAGASHATRTLSFPTGNWLSSVHDTDPAASPSRFDIPTWYFPETRYIPTGADEQRYVLTCVVEERSVGSTTVIETVYSAPLPRLNSLFRNTHVKIHVTVNDNASLKLILHVQPWVDAPVEEWDYRNTVTVAEGGFLHWSDNATDDRTEARLVFPRDNSIVTGTFTLSAPLNDEWYAWIIPTAGDNDAFMFVDASGNELTGDPHGPIGTEATLRIKCRNAATTQQNEARLQIMVRTADNRFFEADVCEGGATSYTLIQNRTNLYTNP